MGNVRSLVAKVRGAKSWKVARVVLAVAGVISLWTGLTVPQQAEGVGSFLGGLGQDAARWLLVGVGLALIAVVLWLRPPPPAPAFKPEDYTITWDGNLIRREDHAAPAPEPSVPGWESDVIGIRRNDRDPWLILVFLKLWTPEGKPSDTKVFAELTIPPNGTTLTREGQWEDFHLQPGEPPHYSLIFPASFQERLIENGRYEVRWRQDVESSWRWVTPPHVFEVRNGAMVTDD